MKEPPSYIAAGQESVARMHVQKEVQVKSRDSEIAFAVNTIIALKNGVSY